MFREIRRKKNAISLENTKELLSSARIGILALNGDEGYPYAIPINYFYDRDNGKIYFHGAATGHKVDSIKNSDKVCLTVYGKEEIKAEEWAPFVKSVVVFGRCRMITDSETALKLVKRFAMKYYPDEATADEEIARSGKAVRMFEIEIEHISGKEVQER